jgi:hypothetical protein
MVLDGSAGDMVLKDKNGKHSFSLHGNIEGFTGLWLGANVDEGKKAGKIFLRDGNGNDSIVIDGLKGEILLHGADCAEEFDISPSELSQIEPGTVMVIDNNGKLQTSSKSYDKRVAGVVSVYFTHKIKEHDHKKSYDHWISLIRPNK